MLHVIDIRHMKRFSRWEKKVLVKDNRHKVKPPHTVEDNKYCIVSLHTQNSMQSSENTEDNMGGTGFTYYL